MVRKNIPEKTPEKIALRYGSSSNFYRPRGKPKTTWVSKLKTDLNEMNILWLEAENLANTQMNGLEGLIYIKIITKEKKERYLGNTIK